jgi:hypothetical protein
VARKKSPPELIIERFGGARKAARMLGYKSPMVIAQWKHREKIPNSIIVHDKILSVAKANGIKFTAEELKIGGYV